MEGEDNILGCQVPPTIVTTCAEQDDHLNQLREREVDTGRACPLQRKDGIISPLIILKIEGRKGVSENCLVTCPTMLNLEVTEVNQRQKELRSEGVHDLRVMSMKT